MEQNNNKRYAIICSGGNAPGMASCVISFTKKCLSCGIEPIAFANGFDGLHDNKIIMLKKFLAQHCTNNGSALIGSSRSKGFKENLNFRQECVNVLKKNNIDALVVVGGEGSFKGALELSKLGIKVIAIPATIDNDLPCTAYTIGFDTCLNTISDVLGDIDDVFVSHRGAAIVELMGRTCPDLTIRSGIANNATYMVTKFSKLTKNGFLKIAKDAYAKGKANVIFLVTEHLYPSEGTKSLKEIARYLEEKTGYMSRHIEIGYMQRGGKPSARDKLLANYMINIGIEELLQGRYSKAICRKTRKTIAIDLDKAIKMKRRSWNQTLINVFNNINQQ